MPGASARRGLAWFLTTHGSDVSVGTYDIGPDESLAELAGEIVVSRHLSHVTTGSAAGEPHPAVAARNYEILIEGAQRAHLDGRIRYDLRSDFIAAYGIEPLAFMGIGMLHALPWIHLDALARTPSAFWEAGRSLATDLTRLGLDQRLNGVVVADRGWFEQQLAMRSPRTFSSRLIVATSAERFLGGGYTTHLGNYPFPGEGGARVGEAT